MRPSRPFAFLLLLCLLFAQMAAGAHALSHLPAAHGAVDVVDAPDGDGRGASHVCLECLAGHGLDLAPPPAIRGQSALAAPGALAAPASAAPSQRPVLRPNSRAPPALP